MRAMITERQLPESTFYRKPATGRRLQETGQAPVVD